MLIVVSPAKTLDFERPLPPLEPTRPRFEAEALSLAKSAANLTQKRLRDLMHISPALAKLNAGRYREFEAQEARPAIHAFAGDVYAGFEARSLDQPAIAFAQDHLRILSGLYGLLRPLDAIRPHRLEMGTRWAPRRKSLTDWWGGRIADRLAADVEADGSDVVINAASQEYWAAVDGRLPAHIRVITLDFREDGAEGLRFNSFAAKRARGMAARYLCEHRLSDPEALKGFDSDGYAFDPATSDDAVWRFVRSV